MPNSIQVTELLQRGIAAAKAGRTQEARHALLRVTELDERNEQAWLWLSGVVESFEERRMCLENVLAINPDNGYAQSGLRWLDQQAPPAPATEERCPRCEVSIPQHQAQGWGETLRRMCGLMLIPALAALVNAGMIPWKISPVAWSALVVASAGAYLWVCATDVPRNPAMRDMFGPEGVKGVKRQVLVGIPGVLLWATAFGAILMKR